MKKIFYYIAAPVITLGLASCTKVATTPEQPATPEVPGQMTIVAHIEDGDSSKATLSGDDQTGYQVLWSEGDQIILVKHDISITTVYTLSEGAGSTSGTFAGATLTDGDYMAYYAYDRAQPLKFGEQTSNSEQFVSHAPMTAIFTVSGGESSPIVFRNACGLLRLNLKGTGTVKSIKITTNEALVSHYDNFGEDGSMGVQDPPHGSRALKYITLNCGSSGRKLTESYQSFYIAMPPGDYTGVKIDVSDFAGHTFTKTLKAEKKLNIVRAKITPAALTVTGLTNDNVPLSKNSPEGTIGPIDGREGMVVDLGGTIGKVAIATRNVDSSTPTKEASSATAAGSRYNFYDAQSVLGTSGWYVPSKDEWKALVEIQNSHVGSCQEWVIGTGENQHKLYFRWAGQSTFDSWGTHEEDGLFYWSSTEHYNPDQAYFLGNSSSSYRLFSSCVGLKRSLRHVRPFHKLN